MMCLTLLAFATSSETERWKITLLGLGSASILLLGSLSRGAWLATALGVAVLVVLHTGRRKQIALWAAGAVVVVGVALAAAAGPVLHSGSVVFQRDFEQGTKPGRFLVVDPTKARSGTTALRLGPGRDTRRAPLAWNVPVHHRVLVIRAWVRGEPGRRLTSTVIFQDASQDPIGRQHRVIVGRGRWSELHWLVVVPDEARSFRLWASAGRKQSPWLVDDVTVRGLDSAAAASVAQLISRASSLVLRSKSPTTDGGVSYRLLELRSVLSAWRQASVPRLLAGQGLGARFAFDNYTWTREGRQVKTQKASYIHNFYLFLAFKLGVAGIAALAGLVLITSWLFSVSIPATSGRGGRWFVVAAAAAWVAYLAWSVTSPEIYDFRLAPLWGALFATCWMEIRPGHAEEP